MPESVYIVGTRCRYLSWKAGAIFMAGAKLSDTQVAKTKVKDKPYKLSDGHGLFLYVTPAGGKYWRWQYRFQGKPQLLSVGEYPSMSLKEARTAHQQWQRVLRGGANPAVEKKAEKKAEE